MLIALLLAAAAPDAPPPPPPEPDQDRCGVEQWVGHYLEIRPTLARQGTAISLYPMQARGPALPSEPLDCTSDWKVSDPALGSISDDRTRLDIAPDATPGAELTISYKAGGREVRRLVRIVGRNEVVLTGIRGQSEVQGCGEAAAVGEIEFTEDGRFAITYHPFETYKDYWGRYDFDPASGLLHMVVEDGNYRPDGLDLDGIARFDSDGRLVLEGVFLGEPPGVRSAGRSCSYIFGQAS